MSLAEFSSVMRARASLLNNPKTFVTVDSWTDAMGDSIKVPGAGNIDKAVLGRAASLLVEDGKTIEGRPISQFRNLGQALSHNVAVVTEEGLRRHWDFYKLKMPIVTETTVSKGSTAYKNKPLLKAYIIWYNNMYTKENKGNLELFSNTGTTSDIDEATGIKYSETYANTATNMVAFLKACGLSDKEARDYGQNFEIGHIESQAFIRLKATKQAGNFYNANFIDKIIKLHEYLDLASSSLLPQYEALTASVMKGTADRNNLFVHVEMQLKDNKTARDAQVGILESNTNQGSGRLSRALNFVALLKEIGSTAPIYSEDQKALRIIGQEAEVIADRLNQLYKNYKANLKEVRRALNSSFPDRKEEIAKFLLDLKSSKTLRSQIKDILIESFGGVKASPFNVSPKQIPIKAFAEDISKSKQLHADIKKASNNIKNSLNKLKNVKKKAEPTGPALNLKIIQADNYSLLNLQQLINDNLQHVISANMGNGGETRILNYRTGRFAASAKVERMSESRAGMITAFYTYMKNPYQTFEPGYRQGSPQTRDPKLLIAKSIREIAATKVGNRLRAVSI